MEDVEARRRVTQARVGRLGTIDPTGRPHLVPCCFVLDGDTVHSAVDAKPKSTLALRRLDNLRANPGASLLVDHYSEDWSHLWWIRVDGTGRIADDREREGALDALAAKYPQYRVQRPPGAVIAIDVTAVRSWP